MTKFLNSILTLGNADTMMQCMMELTWRANYRAGAPTVCLNIGAGRKKHSENSQSAQQDAR
jgi:hypothetical protein